MSRLYEEMELGIDLTDGIEVEEICGMSIMGVGYHDVPSINELYGMKDEYNETDWY